LASQKLTRVRSRLGAAAKKRDLPRNAGQPTSAPMNRLPSIVPLVFLTLSVCIAQETPKVAVPAPSAALSALPPALNVPKPGPTNGAAYAPQTILQGGVVIPLYPSDSPFLNRDRVREAEVYNLSKAVP